MLSGDVAVGGSLTVSGAANFGVLSSDLAVEGDKQSINSVTAAVFGDCSASVEVAAGESVFLLAHGSVSSDSATDLIAVWLYRDSTSITPNLSQYKMQRVDTDGKDCPFAIAAMDVTPGAGTYTYSLKWQNDGVATAYGRTAALHIIKLRIES
jgi:hypothetical protein